MKPPAPLAKAIRSQFLLDDRITFLNHGSFGAMPTCVFEEQNAWRRRIEAEPIELLARQGKQLLADARRPIGQWLGMRESDFGFVTNATEGINAVLRSLDLCKGDSLLTTSHVYNAVRQAMKHAASRHGAGYDEVTIALPVTSAAQIEKAVLDRVTPNTRLVVIDHITSPTALVFPVEKIITGCAARGVDVLIDGAHAPGMLPLNVPALGAAYYAGNLHKWACGPKGSAFIWARADRRDRVHPTTISHHLGEGFTAEFDWQGTRDISAWLATPRAIRFMAEFGWERVMQHNHAMAVWAQQMLCEKWNAAPISPIDGSMLGSMCTVPLPGSLRDAANPRVAGLQQRLYCEHHIEAPLIQWENQMYIRPCCQIYNLPEDYERLADVMLKMG